MFQHVLVATDGSTLSNLAVDKAMAFARASGARLTALTVTEPFHLLSTEAAQLTDTRAAYDKHVKADAARLLADVEAKAQHVGCQTEQVENEQLHQAIIDTARQRGCDLIVMASHGRRGVSALVIGSVTTKVLTHSTIPVLVYR